MKKVLILSFLSFFLLSCGEKNEVNKNILNKKNKTENQTEKFTKKSNESEESKDFDTIIEGLLMGENDVEIIEKNILKIK